MREGERGKVGAGPGNEAKVGEYQFVAGPRSSFA